MAFFRKKEGSESNVPEIPTLPGLLNESKERELPSLPKDFNEELNRSIIKSAINEGIPSLPENFSEKGMIPSISSNNLSTASKEVYPEHKKFLPEEQMLSSVTPVKSSIKEVQPVDSPESVFVRIDKFKAAKKELADIKKSLLEAETIIKKIREIKTKEDSEVNEINLNLDTIKKKIGEVDSLVFDKI